MNYLQKFRVFPEMDEALKATKYDLRKHEPIEINSLIESVKNYEKHENLKEELIPKLNKIKK